MIAIKFEYNSIEGFLFYKEGISQNIILDYFHSEDSCNIRKFDSKIEAENALSDWIENNYIDAFH